MLKYIQYDFRNLHWIRFFIILWWAIRIDIFLLTFSNSKNNFKFLLIAVHLIKNGFSTWSIHLIPEEALLSIPSLCTYIELDTQIFLNFQNTLIFCILLQMSSNRFIINVITRSFPSLDLCNTWYNVLNIPQKYYKTW